MSREERHSHSDAESRSPQAHASKGPKNRSEDQISQRKAWTLKEFSGKTVWDWLQLLSALAIPVVLAGAGLYLESQLDARQLRTEEKRAAAERELAEQRAQSEALQAYLDQMSSLLLEKDLRDSDEGSEVRTLARARTLTALRRLDPSRKEELLRFLVEADLVQSVEGRTPLITLSRADLSDTDLREANLSGADLSEANLGNANLSHANLSGATLSEANVREANLRSADLSEANVSDADLSDANLSYSILSETDLSGASGLTEKKVEQEAGTVDSATMPNEIFSDDFSDTHRGWPRGAVLKDTKYYHFTDYFHDAYRIFNAPSQTEQPFDSAADALNYGMGFQEDMIVEVDAKVRGEAPDGIDTWGIICRAQGYNNYYSMTIGPAGSSGIYKLEKGTWKTLDLANRSDYFRGGTEENHLRGDCLGDKLTLFVNGRKVAEAEDPTFDSGVVGLYAGDTGDEKLEVLFDNFLVSIP
jgi:uncharacterized protein YjbI with pentapeptide repeats